MSVWDHFAGQGLKSLTSSRGRKKKERRKSGFGSLSRARVNLVKKERREGEGRKEGEDGPPGMPKEGKRKDVYPLPFSAGMIDV